MKKKNVVILGGGFAGVLLAQNLLKHRDKVSITLVDKNNYFSFTPMIPETVSGSISPSNIVHPLRQIFGCSILVKKGTVRSVNLEKRKVMLEREILSYDTLILALGSTVQHYGIPGALENTLPLRTVQDGIAMRQTIIEAYETGGALDRTFVVIGGGPTGVELATEIHELVRTELSHMFPSIKDTQIILVDANNSILATADGKLQKKATDILQKKKIELMLGRHVIKVKSDAIMLDNGSIPTKNVFWAAGMKANKVPITPHPDMDKSDRIKVDPQFRIPGFADAYVIGDQACYIDPSTKAPLPMAAQVAEQEANYLTNIICGNETKHFGFKEAGFLVSLGKFNAAAKISHFRFYGIIAWFTWRTIYLFKLRSLRKKIRVAYDWTIDLFWPKDTSQI